MKCANRFDGHHLMITSLNVYIYIKGCLESVFFYIALFLI